MRKVLFFISVFMCISIVSNAQVYEMQRGRATQNFRTPLDTLINPFYLWEVRLNTVDTSWYTAQSLTGAKWKKISSLSSGGGGGFTGSLNTLRRLDNTFTGTLNHDTTMVGNPVQVEWNKYEPLVKTDTATTAFHEFQFSGSNNGSFNEVMVRGWNVNAGGGATVAHKGALGESWESNYQINPAGTGDRLMEKHDFVVFRDGNQHRLTSFTINIDQYTIQEYHTTGSFAIHHPDTHTPYFTTLGTTASTQFALVNKNNQSAYYMTTAEWNSSGTESYSINGPGVQTTRKFGLYNFNIAKMPSQIEMYDETNTSGQIIMKDNTGAGNYGAITGDATQLKLWNSSGAIPIKLYPGNTQAVDVYSTKAYSQVPWKFGQVATPAAWVDIYDASKHEGLEINQNTSGGQNWGAYINAAGGGGGSNYAMELRASNGTNNRGLWLNSIAFGQTNYAIYSTSDAWSYHKGWLAVGNHTLSRPFQALHVAGQVIVDTLTNGSGTDSVVTTVNGLFKKVAQSSIGGSSSVRLSGLLAANATNTIDNVDNTQEWQWNSLTGSGLKITSTATNATASSNTVKGLEISLSGANTNSSVTTYGLWVSNSKTGTASNSIGVYSTGNQYGVSGNTSSGYGVLGSASSGYGVVGVSSSGVALQGQSDTGTPLDLQANPSSTNTVVPAITMRRFTTSTAAAGIGSSMVTYLQNSSGSSSQAGEISTSLTDATTGNLTAKLVFALATSGGYGARATLAGSGAWQWAGYGSGSRTGTAAYQIATTSGGDIIETAAPLSGSSALNFPSTGAQSSSDLTVTVTGAVDGDVVSIGVPNAAVNANTCYTAWVSATDTVTIRFNNYSSGSVDPASATFKIKILK